MKYVSTGSRPGGGIEVGYVSTGLRPGGGVCV